MTNRIIKGDEIQLFINNNKAPLYATSHTLSMTADTIDVNHKDAGVWGVNAAGKIKWELTGEFLTSTADYYMMHDMMTRRQRVYVKFAEVNNYDDNGLKICGGNVSAWIPKPIGNAGYALITSLSVNANTGENSTYSITFTGAGPLKQVDNSITNHKLVLDYDVPEGAPLKIYNNSEYVMSTWYNNEKIELTNNSYLFDAASVTLTSYLISSSIPNAMFKDCTTLHRPRLTKIDNIGNQAFMNTDCSRFDYDPTMFIRIGDYAFANSNYIEPIINGVTSIGNYAFYNCHLGSTVILPETLTHIGDHAFYNENELVEERVYGFSTDTPPTIGQLAFGFDTNRITIVVPAGRGHVYDSASENWHYYVDSIVEA